MSKPIPGPRSIPFLGTIGAVEQEVPLRSLLLLAKQYGEIYQLNFLGNKVILIGSHRLLDEICDEKRFHKRVGPALFEVRHATKDALFTAFHGEPTWAIAHRILTPAFGPASILGMFEDMDDLCSQLLLKWERFGPEHVINPTQDFTRLTFDTIALCAMGYRFNSFYSEQEQPFVTSMSRFLAECFKRSARPTVVQAFMAQTTAQYEMDQKVMSDVCDQVVAKRKANPTNTKDLLNMMLNGRDPVTGQGLSEENIKAQLITFLIAGHETSSGLASFAVYLLLKNPHAYSKLQAEVDMVLGKEHIRREHLTKLPYTTAVLRESLRLYPPASSFSVCSDVDTVIGDGEYAIPADVPLQFILPQIHRDPAVWGDDAEEFKPERMMPGEFEKLPNNAWKPFGNGMRACIGRGFAMQEITVVLASIFQHFDLRLVDPTYTLELRQTLTIKPNGMGIYAIPRADAPSISSTGSRASKAADVQPGSTVPSKGKTLHLFYGGNTGSCEGFVQKLAERAASHGFRPVIAVLDSATGHMPTDGPVVIITASFEGQPADNAAHFVEYLKGVKSDEFANVQYALLGCGNKEWASTYQAIPRLCDELLQKNGAKQLLPRAETDAGSDSFFEAFEEWEAKLWPRLAEAFDVSGDGKTPEEDFIVHVTDTVRAAKLKQTDTALGKVVANYVLTKAGAPEKRHIEFELPQDMTYSSGDYLAILPINPPDSVRRCLARFSMNPEHRVTIKCGGPTNLPVDTPISAFELLSGYVELAQPATKRNIIALLEVTSDTAIREKLEALSATYKDEVFEKRLSVLEILERHPEIKLPFGSFLRMLPSMRVRQYSISSSPLWNPQHVTLTISVIQAPSLSGREEKFFGVASNYLAQLKPGDLVNVAVRPSSATFHLPPETETPIVMFCAGAGVAPMRGFIQERAAQVTSGRAVGKAYLFVGCRSPDEDFLYANDEFAEWAKLGAVELRPAFSRESDKSEGCKYVQHRIWHDRKDIVDVFKSGAKLYTCGSLAVSQGIKDVCVDIIKDGKGVDQDEALKFFQTMQTERFATDVFG